MRIIIIHQVQDIHIIGVKLLRIKLLWPQGLANYLRGGGRDDWKVYYWAAYAFPEGIWKSTKTFWKKNVCGCSLEIRRLKTNFNPELESSNTIFHSEYYISNN